MYLSGKVDARLCVPGVGFMLTPYIGNRLPEGSPWAADSGAYDHPEVTEERFFTWLDHFTEEERSRCLFAAAIDVPFDSAATSARSTPLLPLVREHGYPVAFCAQDGHTPDTIPWDGIDALFIGGSTAWKLGDEMAALQEEAHRRGKWTHMGRVNGPERVGIARWAGFDSVDGTYARFAPNLLIPDVIRWVAEQDTAPVQTRLTFAALADNPPGSRDPQTHREEQT
jgi:hypothetical protein